MEKQVNVWDTYVTRKNGQLMHFDILVPVAIKDPEQVYAFGKMYLQTKGEEGQPLSAQECRLCHIESLQPKWEEKIADQGYFIIEMEGCSIN